MLPRLQKALRSVSIHEPSLVQELGSPQNLSLQVHVEWKNSPHFQKAAWGDLWGWFTTLLTQETLQNHANQEVQIIMFTLRTPRKLPSPPRVCVSGEPPSIWKTSLQRSHVCHSSGVMAELVGSPRPNSGAWHWVSGQKRVLIFLLHILKNAESDAMNVSG